MTKETNDYHTKAYREGYEAGCNGCSEESNPYSDLAAEFWADGYEDALEDSRQGSGRE